jgi:hypothetical protein
VAPSALVLVLDDEVMTHHNKITVGLTMRHFVRHHSAKNIDVRFWFPTLVCRFKRLWVIKET